MQRICTAGKIYSHSFGGHAKFLQTSTGLNFISFADFIRALSNGVRLSSSCQDNKQFNIVLQFSEMVCTVLKNCFTEICPALKSLDALMTSISVNSYKNLPAKSKNNYVGLKCTCNIISGNKKIVKLYVMQKK